MLVCGVQNEVGETPLHVASDRGNVAVMKALIEGGAVVNAVEADDGLTPLMYAVMGEGVDAAKLLV